MLPLNGGPALISKRRVWTYKELREAADFFAAGETWKQVGSRYGVSGSCVRTLIRRHGITIPERTPRRLPTDRGDLLFRAASIRNIEGLSWSLVAERVGWGKSPQALYKAVQRHSEIRCRTGYPDQRRPRDGKE